MKEFVKENTKGMRNKMMKMKRKLKRIIFGEVFFQMPTKKSKNCSPSGKRKFEKQQVEKAQKSSLMKAFGNLAGFPSSTHRRSSKADYDV